MPIALGMKETKILLADKDLAVRDILFHSLKGKYRIHLFFPHLFNDLFKETYLDSHLAIIDSTFSANNGLKALKELKAAKPSLPIIFTASHGIELCLNAFKLGARDCFRKPFIVKDIVESIGLILKANEKKSKDRSNILFSKYSDSFVVKPALQKLSPDIEKAKNYIEENFSKPYSLDLLAEVASKSKFYFCRAFKKQTGMTCGEYLNFVRVREAKNLLKNKHLSVKEVCHRTGYKNTCHFSRVFKQIENISAFAYQKEVLSSNQ